MTSRRNVFLTEVFCLLKASDEEKVTDVGFEPVTSATAVKKLVTTLQMLIYYRTSNHNIDTVAPLPVAADMSRAYRYRLALAMSYRYR